MTPNLVPPGSLAPILWERAREEIEGLKGKRNEVGRQEAYSFAYSFSLSISFLSCGQPCARSTVGVAKQLLSNLIACSDWLGFAETCSSLRAEFIQASGLMPLSKVVHKSRWAKAVLKLVYGFMQPMTCRHPSHAFDALCTFLGWIKRLPIAIRPQEQAVEAYLACDERISRIDFGSITHINGKVSISFGTNVYIAQLEAIWFEWLKSFELREPFLPRHGSGSTADAGRSRSNKWSRTGWDQLARVCLRSSRLTPVLDYPVTRRERRAKVVFVPKQLGKDRTICMEPAWLQYLQQGVAHQLVGYIHNQRQLRMYINLYSQEVNRELCAVAVMNRYTTLDLSDASDSVSWRLVRILCARLPLLRYLSATRSTTATIAGVERSFDKFAPMGSALCFPIECILFASIVELAYRIQYDQASNGHRSGCSVYGDDIICPSEVDYLVRDILKSLGFVVNPEKSYNTGSYRESCGVEYLDGVMINTIKHPREHLVPHEVESPVKVGLITDLANTLADGGYYHARRFLLTTHNVAKVRIGRDLHRLMDLIRFDDRHCRPVGPVYRKRTWNRKLQASGYTQKSIVSTTQRGRWDHAEFQHSLRPSLRAERLRRWRIKLINPHPKWTLKGITALSSFGHFDLLVNGDIEDVGVRRTGRTRQRVVRGFIPLDNSW